MSAHINHPSLTAAPPPLTPQLQSTIYGALMHAKSIPVIQSTLTHELQASGWTTAIRAYILALLRSGECATYDEVMARVLQATQLGQGEAEKELESVEEKAEKKVNGETNGVNGTKKESAETTVDDESIRIPERAIKEGVRVVRRELEKCCDIEIEGE